MNVDVSASSVTTYILEPEGYEPFTFSSDDIVDIVREVRRLAINGEKFKLVEKTVVSEVTHKTLLNFGVRG